MFYGWMGSTDAYGRVSKWASQDVGGIAAWCLCSPCVGPFLAMHQRMDIETKLYRWHKERGVATIGPNLDAHKSIGAVFDCSRSHAIAENLAVMNTFKLVQHLSDDPPGKPQQMERSPSC